MHINLPNLIGSVVLVFMSFNPLIDIGTDKGVSAIRIVVTGKMEDYDDEFSDGIRSPLTVNRLNMLLPEDIRVFSCRLSRRFHHYLFLLLPVLFCSFVLLFSSFLFYNFIDRYKGEQSV